MPLNAFRRWAHNISACIHLQTMAVIFRKDRSHNFKSLFKKRTNPDVYAILNAFRFHCTPINSKEGANWRVVVGNLQAIKAHRLFKV